MVSKRVLEMWDDPETVWGKNKELEKFWGDLASGKTLVLIYKDKTHEYVAPPKRTTKKHATMMKELEEDTNIVAILSSNLSQDAYELYLYPKAKDKTVDYVITHYKKYFIPIVKGAKLRVPG
jgi:hypothetical protein